MTIDVTAKSPEAAGRVEKFLNTLRETGEKTRFAPLMKTVKLERVEAHLLLSATVPAAMIVGALGDGTTAAPPPQSDPAKGPRPFEPTSPK